MYVTADNFSYKHNFPGTFDASITSAVSYVEAAWTGIYSLWGMAKPEIAILKRTAIENLLVAWYLADLNPLSVSGVIANGFPMNSKTIGGTKGVSLTFRQPDVQPGMEVLTTNEFGNHALSMMMSAPERFGLYGPSIPGFPRGTGGGQGM